MSRNRRMGFRVALILSALPALTGCAWAMYRSNAAHTGYVPGETAIGVQNVATLEEKSAIAGSGPVVAEGKLFVIGTGFVEAYDALDYELVWRAPIMGGGRTPAVRDGIAFVSAHLPSEGAKLYAFDAAGAQNCGTPTTCEPLWTADLDIAFVSPPTVAGGVVLVNGVNVGLANQMAVFDAAGSQGCSGTPKTCTPLWTADTGPPAQWLADDIMQRSPAVANGLAFVSGADNKVHVYDAEGVLGCAGSPKQCSELWSADTNLGCDEMFGGCGISAPAIAGNVLYVTGKDFDGVKGGLFAFDAQGAASCSGTPKTCSPLWTAPGRANLGPPAIAGGVAYTIGSIAFTQGSSRLRAFDAAGVTGCSGTPKVCTPLWTSAEEVEVGTAPAVANGVVYATSNEYDCDVDCVVYRHVFAFAAAGSTACSGTPEYCEPLLDIGPTTSEFAYGDPLIANGVVYVPDDSVHVFALP